MSRTQKGEIVNACLKLVSSAEFSRQQKYHDTTGTTNRQKKNPVEQISELIYVLPC